MVAIRLRSGRWLLAVLIVAAGLLVLDLAQATAHQAFADRVLS